MSNQVWWLRWMRWLRPLRRVLRRLRAVLRRLLRRLLRAMLRRLLRWMLWLRLSKDHDPHPLYEDLLIVRDCEQTSNYVNTTIRRQVVVLAQYRTASNSCRLHICAVNSVMFKYNLVNLQVILF
ncbi:hypothetical protein SFRURICE_003680 [Spodoptera frugiperda]|nr:hypothetical protein SFRURICE_003680 [Spodoptera frugiperda]